MARAGEVLQRYQSALAGAVSRREAAESELAAARDRVARLEHLRNEAAAAVEDPGRIPLSPETVTADPVRLLLTGQLDDVETLMAQLPARFLASVTGLTGDIEATARRQLLEEQERDARKAPLWLQPLGNGDIAVTPNPVHPGTPKP